MCPNSGHPALALSFTIYKFLQVKKNQRNNAEFISFLGRVPLEKYMANLGNNRADGEQDAIFLRGQFSK